MPLPFFIIASSFSFFADIGLLSMAFSPAEYRRQPLPADTLITPDFASFRFSPLSYAG
jgi:hypothetical protein